MATATSFTAARMQAIENTSIIDGHVREADGHLILVQRDLTEIDAGPVAGTNVMGVTDSDSLNLTIEGQGTSSDPWNISGEVIFPPDSVEVLDWNTALTPGVYWSTEAANSPTPTGAHWLIGNVYFYPPMGRIIQEVRRVASEGHWNHFTRYWNGGVWSEWILTGGRGSGSTSERNRLYPTPTTDAERVALANRKVRWFNDDLGWEESYYAPSGLTGLTATGLIAGVAAGWYPTGEGGPIAAFYPTASFTATTGGLVGNWHNGATRRKGGSDFCEAFASGRIQVKIPGWYEIEVQTTLTSGAGTANFHLRHVDSANNVIAYNDTPMTLMSSYNTTLKIGMQLYSVQANEQFELFCQSGNLAVHAGSSMSIRGQFVIRYMGPAIVLN